MLTVWLDAWQVQCCGTPFAMGDDVRWTLEAHPDTDVATAVLGDQRAASITHSEEHHGGLPDGSPETRGRVRSIRAVSCTYGPGIEHDTRYPVSGSAVVEGRLSADGWEAEPGAQRFVAYLVELEVTP